MIKPRRQNYETNEQYQEIVSLYTEIARLREEIGRLSGTSANRLIGSAGIERAVSIPAASDPNATAQVYGSGINPSVPSISITSSVGASFGSSPSFNMTISNAATFRTAIDAPKKTAAAASMIIGARLTPAGNDGTVTINADGTFTFTAAT